jgi:hypothetical protein
MASESKKYTGYRPYFVKPNDWEVVEPDLAPIKEITLMPSTIETIDYAFHTWINEELDIFVTTNKGWNKVPVIWVAAERAFQIKDNKDLRDDSGRLKLPLITINRTSLVKDPAMKGVAWAHIPPKNDPRGGAILMARRINQNKTSNFANKDANKLTRGQTNFPTNNKKVVYNTITSPVPTYVVATYDVVIRTEYQQQLNEIFTPFIVRTGQINNFFIMHDGHKFEGFIQGEFGLENNVSNMDEAERTYKTTINIKILAYLVGSNKNEERPKITIRENAVEVRIPREKVIVGDKRPWLIPPKKE